MAHKKMSARQKAFINSSQYGGNSSQKNSTIKAAKRKKLTYGKRSMRGGGRK